MPNPTRQGGFQPRNTPAERRAFFDHERQLNAIIVRLDAVTARLDTADAYIAALESRVDDLEAP